MLQPDNPDKVLKGGQLGAVKNGQPDELHRVWHQVAVCTYPHLSKPHLGRFKIQVAQGCIQSRSKNGRSGLENITAAFELSYISYCKYNQSC